MYLDIYSMQLNAQTRSKDLAHDYSNALHDWAWLASKLGVGLAGLANWLESWSASLRTQSKQVALETVQTPQTSVWR